MSKYKFMIEDIIVCRVYKLYNTKDDKIYIGSTIETLKDRMRNHINKIKRSNSKLYNHMREIGLENYRIKLISCHIVENELQLRMLEQYEINKYNHEILLNSQYAYVEDKNMQRKNYNKRYYEKKKIKQKNSNSSDSNSSRSYVSKTESESELENIENEFKNLDINNTELNDS